MDWIGIPDSQEVVLRWGDSPPVKIDLSQPQPVVYQEGRITYPSRSTWERLESQKGTIEEWGFKIGPVLCLTIWTDNSGQKWLAVYWRH